MPFSGEEQPEGGISYRSACSLTPRRATQKGRRGVRFMKLPAAPPGPGRNSALSAVKGKPMPPLHPNLPNRPLLLTIPSHRLLPWGRCECQDPCQPRGLRSSPLRQGQLDPGAAHASGPRISGHRHQTHESQESRKRR